MTCTIGTAYLEIGLLIRCGDILRATISGQKSRIHLLWMEQAVFLGKSLLGEKVSAHPLQ